MKALQQLAQSGGKPIRQTLLPYSRQLVDESDIKAVEEALRADIITRGPYVDKFEKTVAELVGMPFAVSFTSATAALHAVMSCYKIAPDKKVLTTPITFAATANSVRYCGGQVVFSDVERSTMNLDPNLISDGSVDMVVAVDFAGNPCRYNELRKKQKEAGFILVDDASHSIGAMYDGALVGSHADMTVFSFHPVKAMTTGEGGMVVTKDKEAADYLRQFRSHGIVRGEVPGYYEQRFLGYNYNMTDIQAALGLSQLKRLPSFIARRNELASTYLDRLKHFPLELPAVTPGARSGWHLFPVRLLLDKLTVSREDFLRALHAENIGANVHYIPVHFHPYYQGLGYKPGLCPVAESSYAAEVSIPLYQGMTDQDQTDVVLALEKLLNAFAR